MQIQWTLSKFLCVYFPLEAFQLLVVIPLLLDIPLDLKLVTYFVFVGLRQAFLYTGYLAYLKNRDPRELESFVASYPRYVNI